jgi:hypothetical protein
VLNNFLPTKRKMKKYFLFLSFAFYCIGLMGQITTGSLLEELIDREALVKFPSPAYTIKQFSSYDRASVSPTNDGWFGNDDNNQFIRVETHTGRREYVLFDAQGPGAVVRFWATVAGYSKPMTLRIYLDGTNVPVIQGELLSYLGNGGLVAAPLAASVANTTVMEQRGYNCYLPVPYEKSCKITVECENALVSPAIGEVLYYNINYRTYPAGTDVRSFTMQDISSKYSKTLGEVTTALRDYKRNLPANTLTDRSDNINLAPGEKTSLSITGAKAIRKIKIKIAGQNAPQALRSTILSVFFDGIQRVWAPVGDFFGTGYLLSPYKSWYTEVEADGTMSCYWLMPFAEQCTINLENMDSETVTIEQIEVLSVNREWEASRDMYFGAGWFEEYKIPSKQNNNSFDLNLLTLTGKGVLVGNGVTVFNSADAWWGEGDEKIYVDNETFPSCFGTGSEDYYGYAWCLPAKFYHPFIAQPDGSGNVTPGYSVNLRYRALDAIPFTNQLKFDMEIWHWAYTRINYAPISYYYLQQGTSNQGNNTVMAQKRVVTEASQLFNNTIDETGTVEFEDMPYRKSNGSNNAQYDTFGLHWGSGYQAWWTNASVNDWIEYTFASTQTGKFQVEMNITQANDYARYEIWFNDKKCTSIDAYSPFITTRWISLGTQTIVQGNNSIRIVLAGRNDASVGTIYMAGFDRLRINLNAAVDSVLPVMPLYPNPVYDIVYFGCQKGSIAICDCAGKKVIETTFDSGQLDISSLKQGIYVLRLQFENQSYTTKLIKYS